jgi:hypothetical protein
MFTTRLIDTASSIVNSNCYRNCFATINSSFTTKKRLDFGDFDFLINLIKDIREGHSKIIKDARSARSGRFACPLAE